MSRKRYRDRRRRRQVPIPIASMGDIAFLLIIFFMVLSEVAKDKNLDLELPVYAMAEESDADIIARIAMDKEGLIYFDGQIVESAKDVEWALRAMLAKAERDEQRHVQFKCHSSLTKSQFEPVIKAIAEAGGIIEAVADKPAKNQ